MRWEVCARIGTGSGKEFSSKSIVNIYIHACGFFFYSVRNTTARAIAT